MGKVVHNKLVRDKIPDIIRADGAEPIVRVLDETEYRQRLLEKLVEEATELRDSDGDSGERADVEEVLRALDDVLGYSAEKVETVRSKKAQARGAFQDRIFLKEVITQEDR